MSERKQISISGILQDLENGLTRDKIGQKYDINPREVKALFQHPKLKGKKAKQIFVPSFEIVDDTGPESQEVAPEDQGTGTFQ